MNDILLKSATELTQLIRTKALSSTEVTKAFLARIEDVNPSINAVCAIGCRGCFKSCKKSR